MKLDKLEIFVHDYILKNVTIRRLLYGFYQRVNVFLFPQKPNDDNIRRISPDDGFEYFFGYYDKCPWSFDGKDLLALQVKSSTMVTDSTEKANIVLIPTTGGQARVIAQTRSWNVQQGCMLQWLSDSEILYNDFRDDQYCTVILDINTKEERIIERPVYTVAQNGRTALSLDFSRLHNLRPGYGYANLPEKTANEMCPDSFCIWKIDIVTGEHTGLLKYSDFYNFEHRPDMKDSYHKVNHLMINPSGTRFMVIHRWLKNDTKFSRLLTCNMDGSELFNLSDDDFVSHCWWKNDQEIVSYLRKKDGGKAYYLLSDRSEGYRKIWENLILDGHPSFSPNGHLAVTDTYPNRKRIQSLYVVEEESVHLIGSTFSPFRFSGDVRCDLHPRWNREGTGICFDGASSGSRAIYMIDINSMQEEKN